MTVLHGGRQCGDCCCSICLWLWVQCFSIVYCNYKWIMYSPYWRVLEMVLLSSQICITPNKHTVHYTTEILWWNWKYHILNAFRLSAVQWLLLCSLSFKMPHKITKVQIWWMRRPYSPAYYYCQNNVNIAENCLWCELLHCTAGSMKCSLAIERMFK
jgi:hypothetical protein